MVLLRRVFATGIFALVVVLAAAPAIRAQQGGEGGGSGLGTGDWGLERWLRYPQFREPRS